MDIITSLKNNSPQPYPNIIKIKVDANIATALSGSLFEIFMLQYMCKTCSCCGFTSLTHIAILFVLRLLIIVVCYNMLFSILNSMMRGNAIITIFVEDNKSTVLGNPPSCNAFLLFIGIGHIRLLFDANHLM